MYINAGIHVLSDFCWAFVPLCASFLVLVVSVNLFLSEMGFFNGELS